MTVTEILKSAHFVVDQEGKQKSVILDIQAWNSFLRWVEKNTGVDPLQPSGKEETSDETQRMDKAAQVFLQKFVSGDSE